MLQKYCKVSEDFVYWSSIICDCGDVGIDNAGVKNIKEGRIWRNTIGPALLPYDSTNGVTVSPGVHTDFYAGTQKWVNNINYSGSFAPLDGPPLL